MSLPDLSIKRPIFIASVFTLILGVGYLSLKRLPVDLFPNVTFPVVQVTTVYPGAGPQEIETLVSKPLESELAALSGLKTLRSINKDSVSVVIAAFDISVDIKHAEQQVRDKVALVKRKFPADAEDSIVYRMDPADRPIVLIALTADLPEAQLFDLADENIRSKIEQIGSVGKVEVLGGRKREIKVELDRNKLNSHEISAIQVSQRLAAVGKNIPAGKVDRSSRETVYRLLGEFESTKQIESAVVSFFGNDVPVKLSDVATVRDGLEDEKSRTFLNGKKALLIAAYKQSGANTVAVADAVKKGVEKLNQELATVSPGAELAVIQDGSKMVRDNVADVRESIVIGIILTVIVVFFFLGNGRSTIITGLALPNSLLGAFILMALFGFSINIMTLLGLSLAVGLLIDDAIVVRENIFRHMEMGKSGPRAASEGTKEVMLAVVATTFTVLAVFGPISFIDGVVGQFFKEFGLTICFAMLISLFDAVTMAPMLSAYFAGAMHGTSPKPQNWWDKSMGRLLKGFDRFQSYLEDVYESVLKFTLRRPIAVLVASLAIFLGSLWITKFIPKVFLPAQDFGEFDVDIDLPPGTTLEGMSALATKVDSTLRANPEVKTSVLIVGSTDGEVNKATFKIQLVPRRDRAMNTSQFKETVRQQLKVFAHANPRVKEVDFVGTGIRPFNLNLIGADLDQLEKFSNQVFARLKDHPSLKDVETSHRPGKPEVQLVLDKQRAEMLGISSSMIGQEIRTQVEGATPAVFREDGREYNVRVRVREDQRDIKSSFPNIHVPNINFSLVRINKFAGAVDSTGPATINREDRGRFIRISADMSPDGPGMATLLADIDKMFRAELPPPAGVRYSFAGDAENFKELSSNMLLAGLLGIIFIYFVLASLYESVVAPFTIMLVLPLAACGAFFALYLTSSTLDLFSMIGSILLLGIATKNSILLVDYTKQLIEEGVELREAIIKAGRTRLRPILMTSFALIAGMLPVAIGLNEASRQRVSMGISVIGGLISSTLLTLIVVPAAYQYIERFRIWGLGWARRITNSSSHEEAAPGI